MPDTPAREQPVDLSRCWSLIGTVDVVPLAAWLATAGGRWPDPSTPTKPQRLRTDNGLPWELVRPVVDHVLSLFPGPVTADGVMLSRMLPGQSHPLHVDRQRADWLTRVHVPIVTNPGAWLLFEEEGERVHFEGGRVYAFDTTRRHAFGNDGTTDRVHLLLDVLRKDG